MSRSLFLTLFFLLSLKLPTAALKLPTAVDTGRRSALALLPLAAAITPLQALLARLPHPCSGTDIAAACRHLQSTVRRSPK